MDRVKEELKENIRSLIKKYPTIFGAYTAWLMLFLSVAGMLVIRLTGKVLLAGDVSLLLFMFSVMILIIHYVARWEARKKKGKEEK